MAKRTHEDMGLAYEAALLAQQLHAPKGGRQQHSSASPQKIKVCSQCGTTRTPQWREGPLGPKTLCNACGVKRVRALKAIQEGRKPPASPQLKKAAAAAAAAAQAAAQQQSLQLNPPPRQESVDVAMTLQLLASKTEAADSGGRARPMRPAAVRGVRRAVELELFEDGRQGKGSVAPAESNPTDSGEEISWSPRHVAGAGHAGGSCEEEDTEAAAAANLLSMSMRPSQRPQQQQQQQQQQLLAGPRQQQAQQAQAQAHMQQQQVLQQLHTAFHQQQQQQHMQQQQQRSSHQQHLLAAVKHEDVDACQALLGPAMPALAELLSPQQLLELVRAREQVEGAQREAAAADAAVAAVSKILEVKQEAALHARGTAMAAAKALHALLLRLDCEFSVGAAGAGAASAGAGAGGSPARRSTTPPPLQQQQAQLMQQAQQLQHAQQLQQQAQQLQAQQQQAAALALAIAALAPAPGLMSA